MLKLLPLAAALPTNPTAILGIVAGALGVVYGLKAKHFATGFFGFTPKPPEKIKPRWMDRAIVISIAAVVLVASIVALVTNR